LKCPLTHAIFLDPVIASNGVVYERKAIADYIADQKKKRPAPFPSPSGADGSINPEAELSPADAIRKSVGKYLRDVYPACCIAGAATSSSSSSTLAPSAFSSLGAEAWTITVKSPYLPGRVLKRINPSATLISFITHVKRELDLPGILPLGRD
jgi:hypothetical protein